MPGFEPGLSHQELTVYRVVLTKGFRPAGVIEPTTHLLSGRDNPYPTSTSFGVGVVVVVAILG